MPLRMPARAMPPPHQQKALMIPRAQYILLNLYHILTDGLFDTVPVVLSFMALSFGSGGTEVGLIVSLGAALSTAAGLGTVFFSQNLGFTRSVALLTALGGAGFVGAAFAGNMAVAGICFTLAVAGYAVFHNISFSYLTLNTERCRLGRVISDFTAIGDVGRIPLVSLAAFAAAYSIGGFPGWRVICAVYGVFSLCAALWLFRTRLKSAPEAQAANSTAHGGFLPSFAVMGNRNIFLAMLASILNAFSNDRIFTFLPLLLVAKGVDEKIIGSFALGFTLGSFLGKMACGRLIDKFGTRRVFIIAELALTALISILLFSTHLALIVFISLLIGIVTKGTVPIIQTIITEPAQGAQSYDDIFSINSFFRGITNIITPLLFGVIASAFSMETVYCLMAVVSAIAVVPVKLMDKRPPARAA